MIKQFLTETCWDEEGLDYLIIDTPPGTSDEHISTIQFLQGALGMSNNNNPSDDNMEPNIGGAVVVTTPEEVRFPKCVCQGCFKPYHHDVSSIFCLLFFHFRFQWQM